MTTSRYNQVALILLAFALAGANLFWTAHEVEANQAAQQRQGQVVERKLCTTLEGLAAERPPAGDPRTNPSRAYLQEQHAELAQLGADLGCR